MRTFLRRIALALGLSIGISPAMAAGTIPFALQQQINANGMPIVGCQLFIFQTGTVATLQNAFQDFGLSIPAANPLSCDATGRIPMFWLADGTVHVRLTDAGGTVIVDIPVMQTLGPSSGGGGGGGGSVDPTTIASTGDIKFRATAESLTGWVKMNQQTVGSATSGASGRANNDTQSLFVYLWNNCPDAHCPVVGGRGASGLLDFQANKQITLPDMRSRMPFGRDQMDAATPAGRLLSSNVTSGGGDGVDTSNATGGETNHTLTVAEMPTHAHTITDPGHTHPNFLTDGGHFHSAGGLAVTGTNSGGTITTVIRSGAATIAGGDNVALVGADQTGTTTAISSISTPETWTSGGITGNTSTNNSAISITNSLAVTGITVNNSGSNGAHNNMSPFMLGSWYIKL